MPPTAFLQEFKDLASSKILTDAVVRCDATEWKVHRESETHAIDLIDDDPNIVQRLVDYAYNFEYDDTPATTSSVSSALEINVLVYAVADKYECADLAAHAVKKFRAAAAEASKQEAPPYAAIRLAYSTTPAQNRGLRDVCVKLWADMEDQVESSDNKMDVHNIRYDGMKEFYWDTCLLAPSDWQSVSRIFSSARPEEHNTVLEIMRREYHIGSQYHEIDDLEGDVVGSIAVMLFAMINKLCAKVQRWGGDKDHLLHSVIQALEPALVSDDYAPPDSREFELSRALNHRAQRQLKLYWQSSPDNPEAAAKETFESILCNFETCSVISRAARKWVKDALEWSVGSLQTSHVWGQDDGWA